MKYNYFVIAIVLSILPYLIGCGSGSYNIEKGDYKDTTQFKSTGAKLKNYYKIQSPPTFTLQLSGGLNLGLAELSSNYQSNFDSAQFSKGYNFGVKNGYGFSLVGKLPLHQKGNVRLSMSAGFNRFESDFLASESSFGDVGYSVYSFGVGVENCFSPSFRLKPFIAGELQANFISGKANMNQGNNTTRVVTFGSSFRIGYMIYGGFEYMFNNRVGMNVAVKLTNSNQIGKETKTSSDPNNVKIRDEIVEGDEIIEFGGYKNFIFTSLMLGVNYYFGVKDIIYRFNK